MKRAHHIALDCLPERAWWLVGGIRCEAFGYDVGEEDVVRDELLENHFHHRFQTREVVQIHLGTRAVLNVHLIVDVRFLDHSDGDPAHNGKRGHERAQHHAQATVYLQIRHLDLQGLLCSERSQHSEHYIRLGFPLETDVNHQVLVHGGGVHLRRDAEVLDLRRHGSQVEHRDGNGVQPSDVRNCLADQRRHNLHNRVAADGVEMRP
mmetsp:Transcript_34352/g.65637  ORF Transcript_34352/g.65637 Transcript_34352/m.65637 type:complete len:207 (+) Transcript_34352:630-1250(+)